MKKFIISVILLLLFGGVIYFLGLPHLAVPQGSWGVIETKPGGVEAEVIPGGQWSWQWRWEKVLPTVMKIHVFKPEEYSLELENPIKGQIFPSAEAYATALEGVPDFSFTVYYHMEFSILPDRYPQLVRQNVLPGAMDNWKQQLAVKLGERISRLILNDPEILYADDFNGELSRNLATDPDFNLLEIHSIVPTRIKLPDYDLYLAAKEYYLKRQELMFQAEEQKLANELTLQSLEYERSQQALRKEIEIINNIEEYGDILSNYPVLLQFLYLRSMNNEDILQLGQGEAPAGDGE